MIFTQDPNEVKKYSKDCDVLEMRASNQKEIEIIQESIDFDFLEKFIPEFSSFLVLNQSITPTFSFRMIIKSLYSYKKSILRAKRFMSSKKMDLSQRKRIMGFFNEKNKFVDNSIHKTKQVLIKENCLELKIKNKDDLYAFKKDTSYDFIEHFIPNLCKFLASNNNISANLSKSLIANAVHLYQECIKKLRIFILSTNTDEHQKETILAELTDKEKISTEILNQLKDKKRELLP